MNDSPHPHCSSVMKMLRVVDMLKVGGGWYELIFGFRNTNRWLNLSSIQSISLPIILNSALLSIRTLTPSCSTVSSNAPAFSTYSKLYASPEHPRFFTPILIIFGSGNESRFRSCVVADGVRDIAAFRALNRDRFGTVSGSGTGFDF